MVVVKMATSGAKVKTNVLRKHTLDSALSEQSSTLQLAAIGAKKRTYVAIKNLKLQVKKFVWLINLSAVKT